MIKQYLYNILVSIDQFINVIFGGDPDMTISGRWGKLVHLDKCVLCKWACKLLDLVDKDHCRKAAFLESDEGKDQVF